VNWCSGQNTKGTGLSTPKSAIEADDGDDSGMHLVDYWFCADSDADHPPVSKRQKLAQKATRKKADALRDKQEQPRREDKFGVLPAAGAVVIGNLADKVVFKDTATHFGIHDLMLEKKALASACDCGVDDKCWAVAMSKKPWPLKLELCNKKGQPGHQAHDSAQHKFTAGELKTIGYMCVQQKQKQAGSKVDH
jgi:hypothetical protein